ncbi:MAG: LysR family transcriptional regulator [Nevskia sp.]|nr:LysR family transcriptional regulator [Nevskia sp.]
MTSDHVLPGLRRIDLNLLRVFETVYRERNLTRSAAALALSQSAVSHALARLRAQLGDALFVRQGFGVRPTPLATRLAPAVQEALAGLRSALQRGVGFDPAADLDNVAVAVPEEMEMIVLPPLVAHLRRIAPRVVVSSLRIRRGDLPADLASGRLDLAIDVARVTGAELRHAPLAKDPFCVLAAGRRRLSARDYMEAGHVAVSSRRSGPVMEDFILNRLGLHRRVLVRCQNYVAACRIAAASELLLTLPRRYAQILSASAGLNLPLLPMPLEMPEMEIHVYWHRQSEEEPASQWLRAQLQKLPLLAAPAPRRPLRPAAGPRGERAKRQP